MKKLTQKTASARVGQQTVVVAEVEFDAKHTDSPLCACRACNDDWLARRNQPSAVKHTRHSAPPLDPANQAAFTARCKALGVACELKNTHNIRIAYWHLVDTSTGYQFSAGFDVDVHAALTRMEAGDRLMPAVYAQFKPALRDAPKRSSSSSPDPLTGGPFCVVCDCAGGLPCPTMVRTALDRSIKLAYPPGDARLLPAHVHPGRCRKRLRQLLDAAEAAATGRVKTVSRP